MIACGAGGRVSFHVANASLYVTIASFEAANASRSPARVGQPVHSPMEVEGGFSGPSASSRWPPITLVLLLYCLVHEMGRSGDREMAIPGHQPGAPKKSVNPETSFIPNSRQIFRPRSAFRDHRSCTRFCSALKQPPTRLPGVSIANRISPSFRDPFKRTDMAPTVRLAREARVL